jgi:DNA-binding LacI/PurR family transcriptional regulator
MLAESIRHKTDLAQRGKTNRRVDMDHVADRRVGLQDVATRAGVALSTASNALTGKGRVSTTTRERVRQAAHELGYLPNPAARGLRVGRSRLIGVATRMYVDAPDLYPQDVYYAILIATSAMTASSRGYALALLPSTQADIAEELPLAAMIVTDSAPDDPAVEMAHTLGIPVVTDYRPNDGRSTVTVDVDVAGAVDLVNGHLLAAGAQRIGLLSVDPPSTSFAVRWDLYHKKWCQERGHVLVVERAASTEAPEIARAAGLLWDAGCDALVGMPIGSGPVLVAEAAKRGRKVPQDVLVAVVDDDPDLGHTDPPITAVGLDPVRSAVEGTNLVIDVIEEKVRPPAELFVDAQLVVRESTQR